MKLWEDYKMKKTKDIPCEDCITLPICLGMCSLYIKDNLITNRILLKLCSKCDIIDNYTSSLNDKYTWNPINRDIIIKFYLKRLGLKK